MLTSGNFWVGVLVGVALLWAFQKYGMRGQRGNQ